MKRTTGIDARRIRSDFPILSGRMVYLDSAATSQKPNKVIEAMNTYYKKYNANVHRGVYRISEEATEAYEAAHRKVADFIGAQSHEEIIFVRNATEAINLVAYSWALANVKKGDEILVTRMEHHSNLVPWQFVCKKTGAKLKFIEIDKNGELVYDDMGKLMTSRTKLVAVTHVSNVLGTVNDISRIIKEAHKVGARVLVDAAQSVPHMPARVGDADFLVFSGHKMCGPTGIGVLYAKRAHLEKMEPFLYGGDMISRVTYENAEWNALPWKFEAGTPNVAGAVGLAAAIGYLEGVGMENVRTHERMLTEYAIKKLSTIKGVTIYGRPRERGGVVAFNLAGVHPHDLASVLDDYNVCVRAGHHCAQPLLNALGVGACARVSFYIYNTRDDVDALVVAIGKAKKVFGV
ncbi:MAG: SufS family cysteine desulfurase [Candidatus Aenigmatarchaeota archaeon]|nr:MAG: SufS family cysteine desulfurase [Candidatus Aenigmarchaeota archaeon]